jgi:hypothetical protein
VLMLEGSVEFSISVLGVIVSAKGCGLVGKYVLMLRCPRCSRPIVDSTGENMQRKFLLNYKR